MLTKLPDIYNKIKALNTSLGYGVEQYWQANVRFEDLTESIFLREHAWVVLASGMKESVVRNRFKDIEMSFLFFRSAKEICEKRQTCIGDATAYFNHQKKIRAIADMASIIKRFGFPYIKEAIGKRGISQSLIAIWYA